MKKFDKKMLLKILIISLALSAICIIGNKSYGVVTLGAIVGIAGLGVIFVYALQVLVVAFRIIRTRFNCWFNSIKFGR